MISMESFRNPNFPLVAEIVLWLVKRYDENVDIRCDIKSEENRVAFIRTIAQFLATKAHVKVNTKRLYQADGYAVKELLKIATLLHAAMKNNANLDEQNVQQKKLVSLDAAAKINEVKLARQLVSDITSKGALLYDLLGQESELKELRMGVLARQVDISEVESSLRVTYKAIEEEIQKTTQLIENVASDEVNLDAKIEKKKLELERNQKRLQTLKKVRPAFMDEYEKLEDELKKVYEVYVVKMRCLTYLEQLLDELERVEQVKMEEREQNMQKLIEQLRLEESLQVDGDMMDEERPRVRRPLPSRRADRDNLMPTRRVFGSMTGGGSDESGESATDSDLNLDGDEEPASELVSDEDLEIEKITSRNVAARDPNDKLMSDDDF